jgi:hypothetical protein
MSNDPSGRRIVTLPFPETEPLVAVGVFKPFGSESPFTPATPPRSPLTGTGVENVVENPPALSVEP